MRVIHINVPYGKNELCGEMLEHIHISNITALNKSNERYRTTREAYESQFNMRWEEMLRLVERKLGTVVLQQLLDSPNLPTLIEFEVREMIQRFILTCGKNGYGQVPGWHLVMANIGESIPFLRFRFHCEGEEEKAE